MKTEHVALSLMSDRAVALCRAAMLSVIFVLSTEGCVSLMAQRVWDWPVIGAPTAGFAPETNWTFGISAAGYLVLPSDTLARTSELTIDGAYTLNKQWYVTAGGMLYLNSGWQMAFRIGYRGFPDRFYGIGNNPAEMPAEPLSYLSRQFHAYVQPLYNIGKGWHLGPVLEGVYETRGLGQQGDRYVPWGAVRAGAVAMYDSRDNIYYPRHGLFFKAQLRWQGIAVRNGAFTSLAAAHVDLRHFVTVYKELVFAWQAYADILAARRALYDTSGGQNTSPEQTAAALHPASVMLPALGGQDVLRGFYTGQFRDEAVVALQAELRFPIYGILRGTAFAGVGDAYSIHAPKWAKPKVGYGLGLRLQFNTAGINIRADVARNNYDNRWNNINAYFFYLTVKEAF